MSCLNTDCEKTYQELDAVTAQRDQLRAELDEAADVVLAQAQLGLKYVTALRELAEELRDDSCEAECCMVCGCSWTPSGDEQHDDDCKLAAALALLGTHGEEG